MQKLSAKLKNVPVDIPHVCCSTSLVLNRDENLSVLDGLKDVKLTDNNLDAALTCFGSSGIGLNKYLSEKLPSHLFVLINADFSPRTKVSGF